MYQIKVEMRKITIDNFILEESSTIRNNYQYASIQV